MIKHEKHIGSVPEDIEDVLKLIEKSYDIRFQDNEFVHIRTFGQLTDHIISRIRLDNKEDCTNQQAFYKLRTALSEVRQIDTSSVNSKALLTDIFPRQTRRTEIRRIEKILGFELKALRPRRLVTNSLAISFILSIVGLFFDWRFGVAGALCSIGGFLISERTGKEFKYTTLGELVDRMTQTNYAKSRRHPGTMNVAEIHNKIEKLFIENLGLEEKTIDRDTVII